MAEPQKEAGYLVIANSIADALCRTYLNGTENKILWAILRKTYGWNKKKDRISYSQFEDMTGLDRRHIAPSLNRLVERNIITRTGSGQTLYYSFQKDYDRWIEPLLKQVTVKANNSKTITQIGNGEMISKPLPISDKPLPKQVTKPLPKSVNTKDKRQTKDICSNYFDKFWEVYPRKDAKTRAKQAFAEAIKGKNNGYTYETFTEKIIQTVKTDKTLWGDKQFVLYAAKWLKEKRWEDSPEKESKSIYKEL